MKRIKAKKSFKGKEGFFYKGHIKEVKNDYADELIKRGMAEEVEDEKELKKDTVEIKVDTPEETKKEEVKEVKKKDKK